MAAQGGKVTRRWGSDSRARAADPACVDVAFDGLDSASLDASPGSHVGPASAETLSHSSYPPPAPPSLRERDEPTLDDYPLACLPGRLLAGKYRIERVLGRGGVGTVVAATHVELGQRVAIKFLLPQALTNEEVVERFAREARAAAKIQNEHVVRVHDVGRLDDGAPFMVMECLTGTDLGEIIETRAPLPVEEAVDYMLQVCDALVEAHALGIVHRDLKPANVFITQSAGSIPCVKVVDFGISKSMLSERPITDELAVMGSPGFMSPEQLWSTRDVDARTDIWSLGALLYELLTGARAYYVENIAHLYEVVSTKTPTSIREFRKDVPPKLEAIIFRCMAAVRERRFRSAADLANALAEFGPPRWTQARASSAPTVKRRKPARWWIALPIAGILGAAFAIFYPTSRAGSEGSPVVGVPVRAPAGTGASLIPNSHDVVPSEVTSATPELPVVANPDPSRPQASRVDATEAKPAVRPATTTATYTVEVSPATTLPSKAGLRTPPPGQTGTDPDEIEFGGRK